MPTSTASAASVFAAAVTLCLLPPSGMPSAHAQPPGSCVPPPYYLDTIRGSWPAYAGING